MAGGWYKDGAVQEQIDADVADAVAQLKQRQTSGPSLSHCEECDAPIPKARQEAIKGVRLCVACQEEHDKTMNNRAGFNRRGSKDSQLR
ncbi:DksA/TraR family C4-type zinc finger protein [Marinicella gelatinilytica]|uniref:DksA/TraR family C4-type zinc finger protein n=1 Tax=Marinicella gelatinilytica TaxID=2996017 RepID=UPI002260846F|nr:DksA/TraR family C4-type zinc finger protein [Marinicella gelatinilytica]MCX7544616.1 DksA/TraR family C4-type zinc finger protein [Marinicella gelatinilytica]